MDEADEMLDLDSAGRGAASGMLPEQRQDMLFSAPCRADHHAVRKFLTQPTPSAPRSRTPRIHVRTRQLVYRATRGQVD